jgi:glycosyltransferase involved in cell wall biosynthesis
LRLLHLHNHYLQPGGEDQVFEAETRLLENHGHTVFRYTRHNAELAGWSALKMAVNTVWNREAYKAIDNLLLEIKPDLCHIHNTFPLISPAVYYACKKHHVPVVQRLPNYRLICPNAFLLRDGKICMECVGKKFPLPGVRYACYRESILQTSAVSMMLATHRMLRTWQEKIDVYIALNHYGKQLFVKGGLPADRIMVSPNVIDPDPNPELSRRLGAYALYIGRLSKEKGLVTLLNAWRLLPDIPLQVIGDGPLMNELVKKTETENINNIEFQGRKAHEETLSILKNARLLVFPSEWLETFGLGIIEAFACGVPVIASRQKTIEEIIQHGKNGILFEPGNPSALAQAVEECWDNPEVLSAMSANARCSFETKYSKQQKYDSLMEIYERAIQTNNR